MYFVRKMKLRASTSVVGLAAVLMALPAAAEDVNAVVVSKKDCARVIAYQPSGDVAYQPGVDAHGRKVAAADLPGSRIIEAPTKITIPLTMELADLFALPEGASAEAGLGTVAYDIQSGKLEFNGKPLTDPQMAAIAAACAKLDQ